MMNALTRMMPLEELIPAIEVDPNLVTPGVIGFVFTFVIAGAVFLLILDMVRRVRRVRYREEINQKLDAEFTAEADS
jgi:hypothetical protein